MAKFIVPATYKAQVGVKQDGFTPRMGELPYDNAGQEVTVPDADASQFEDMGWKRVYGTAAPTM